MCIYDHHVTTHAALLWKSSSRLLDTGADMDTCHALIAVPWWMIGPSCVSVWWVNVWKMLRAPYRFIFHLPHNNKQDLNRSSLYAVDKRGKTGQGRIANNVARFRWLGFNSGSAEASTTAAAVSPISRTPPFISLFSLRFPSQVGLGTRRKNLSFRPTGLLVHSTALLDRFVYGTGNTWNRSRVRLPPFFLPEKNTRTIYCVDGTQRTFAQQQLNCESRGLQQRKLPPYRTHLTLMDVYDMHGMKVKVGRVEG